MIVTVTPNPSLDRTIELDRELVRGAVQRAVLSSAVPAGKGVNVSIAVHTFGAETLAVLPGAGEDPVVVALRASGVPVAAVPIEGALRSNVTITEPDGITTKVNEPGPVLAADELAALRAEIVGKAADAEWVALCGSLPPGVPTSFYADVVDALGASAPLIALDTSGAPAAATIGHARVDLVKPNGEELVELLDETLDPEAVEANPVLAAELATRLLDRGVGAVLCTLGARGAVLVTRAGAWFAGAPRIDARSTVGAGDSSLAGYLLAQAEGATPAECLRRAIAHGSAAAAQPGSAMPSPSDVARLLPAVRVTELTVPIPSATPTPRTVAGL